MPTMLALYNVPILRLFYNLAVRCLWMLENIIWVFSKTWARFLPYTLFEFGWIQRSYLKIYMDGRIRVLNRPKRYLLWSLKSGLQINRMTFWTFCCIWNISMAPDEFHLNKVIVTGSRQSKFAATSKNHVVINIQIAKFKSQVHPKVFASL